MKKILYLLLGVVLTVFLIISYHSWEERERGRLKTEILNVGNRASYNQIRYSWSEDKKKQYIDSLRKDIYSRYPVMCPYCYYWTLKHK